MRTIFSAVVSDITFSLAPSLRACYIVIPGAREARQPKSTKARTQMQVLVIGAGVIGLAIARTAAQAGHDVTVAEMTGGIANGISSRNSEVIHAGLYYPTESLRARHCVRGRQMLYAFCASHSVPHRKCGKLVVATSPAELAKVETILAQAQINGVEGAEMIGGNAARAMEGELSCIGALWSPETGIIDSHAFMRALWGEIEDRGGMIAFATPVERLSFKAPHWRVQFGGREPGTLDFEAVVSAAGLGAQALARRIEGYPAAQVPLLVFGKGNYFGYAGRPGRGMGEGRKLRGRPAPRRQFLRAHPQLLARPAGRLAGAGLFWHSPEAARPRRTAGRFHDCRAGRAWHDAARQSVWHRVAGPDRFAVARRSCGCAIGRARSLTSRFSAASDRRRG